MTRTSFAILMIAIAAAVLLLMWLAWRGRRRRDSAIVVSTNAGSGSGRAEAALATFADVPYVSTTPVGSPFERLAIAGLDYKGPADVTVTASGVTIVVAGERPVAIPAAQLRGTGTANGRIGKVVERDGLSLLRWIPESAPGPEREFESAFRFADPSEQQRFSDAVDAIGAGDRLAHDTHSDSPAAPHDADPRDTATRHDTAAHTTQEDA